ncbi:cation:proton antiporter domain-containing protein [Streptomyces sp. NPDC054796]
MQNLAGLEWTTSFLAGAVLAPTSPVFASATVDRREIPEELRELMNVDSSVSDELALPVVILVAAPDSPPAMPGASLLTITLELVTGLVFGVVLPLVVPWLGRFRLLGPSPGCRLFRRGGAQRCLRLLGAAPAGGRPSATVYTSRSSAPFLPAVDATDTPPGHRWRYVGSRSYEGGPHAAGRGRQPRHRDHRRAA